MIAAMENVREQLQIFVRRFGLLNAACCDACCGQEVTLVQSHILYEVRRQGEPAMQQVAEELGIDITTFSRQIKAMEERQLVTRRPSVKDRRVNLLCLAPEGERVLAQIDRFMADRLNRVFAEMTPFEQHAVVQALGLLNGALGRAAAKGEVACCK
jgi:DNA-binding MarR family transcriptional regulator